MRYNKVFLILLVFTSVIFLSYTANAAKLSNWNIDVSINEDRSADWVITFKYPENVAKSDYFILSDAINVEIFADSLPIECDISRKIGTTIICNSIDAKEIIYKFRTTDFINVFQNLLIFKYRFSVTQLTDKFYVTVKLPLGTAIVEKDKIEGTGLKRFEPAWGREGSDGRRIYVEWLTNDPKLGETFDATLVYENIFLFSDQPILIYLIIVVIAIIVLIIYFVKFRHNIEDMLPILTENERKVMEILIKEKTVDQRKIVKDTDFSKAKVSRVIHDLIQRGLIEKRRKGRTNIIKLKNIRGIEKIKEKGEQTSTV